MKKIIIDKCHICQKEFTSNGMVQHILKAHKMSLKTYIVKYVYHDIHPLCACGCGENTTIRGYNVMEYVNYHSPAGHFTTESVKKRNVITWKKNVKLGIRRYIEEQKQTNPDFRKGKNNNFYGKPLSEERKQLIRDAVEKQIASGKHPFIGNANGRIKGSSLETRFENFLYSRGLQKDKDFYTNYKLSFIPEGKIAKRYKYYDFYIPSKNLLIEIHGIYWHPKTLNEAKNEIQQKNFHNDILKKQLAYQYNYILDVVYENELENYMNSFDLIHATRKDVPQLVTVE